MRRVVVAAVLVVFCSRRDGCGRLVRMNDSDVSPIPVMQPISCADCEGMMRLSRSRFGLYYRCDNYAQCKGALPAMPDGAPRGRPRPKRLRAARKAMHDEIRRLTAGDAAMVDRAYAWLSVALGISRRMCHASRFDVATAERAVDLLRALSPAALRAWRSA